MPGSATTCHHPIVDLAILGLTGPTAHLSVSTTLLYVRVLAFLRAYRALWHFSGLPFKLTTNLQLAFLIWVFCGLWRQPPPLEVALVSTGYVAVWTLGYFFMRRRHKALEREAAYLAALQDFLYKPRHQWPPVMQESWSIMVAEIKLKELD